MRAKVSTASTAMLRILGLFSPILREVAEMTYEFDAPFIMDGTKFTQAFGGQPTTHREALQSTIAWFKQHVPAKA